MHQAFFKLFLDELRDIYNAENQILKALPKVIKAATNPDLIEGLENHLQETKLQVKRLDKIFKFLKENPTGRECAAMKGLVKECDDLLQEHSPSAVLDAFIICACQKIEHYEIASYGTLKTFAHHLNYEEVEDLLEETLKEEGHANKLLTKVAEGSYFWSGINQAAVKQ